MYDRNQYEKGCLDGYNKGIDDFVEKLCAEVEFFEATINGMQADVLTIDYLLEYVLEMAEQLKG